MMDDMDEFTNMLWNSLNEDNKVSLFVRYIDIETGKIRNKDLLTKTNNYNNQCKFGGIYNEGIRIKIRM